MRSYWYREVFNVMRGDIQTGGTQGFGTDNAGFCLLHFCPAVNLAITNTYFKKQQTQSITWKSSSSTTQTDYILIKRSALISVKDVKVIRSEEHITQHKFFTCNIIIAYGVVKCIAANPKLHIYKVK